MEPKRTPKYPPLTVTAAMSDGSTPPDLMSRDDRIEWATRVSRRSAEMVGLRVSSPLDGQEIENGLFTATPP